MPPAIRTLPGDSIAGHPPGVFIHAYLTDGKSTPALPAKRIDFLAAMAKVYFFSPSPSAGFSLFIGWHISILSLKFVCSQSIPLRRNVAKSPFEGGFRGMLFQWLRTGFKIVDWVQGQGGPLNLTGGIYGIFRGLNSADQH